jgi:hypothetical protein|tara:strand:- start:11198 stop:11419 length:222 start_codon:yes stop_codon:yes gene_type:complete
MKGNNMCSLMDVTEKDINTFKSSIEVTNETPVPSIMKDVKWSWAVDILERHIVHKEYISSRSLLTALERIKCG